MPADGPYLLAEIGVNHDGDVDRAADMVRAVAAAGFDGAKFQYWVVSELLAPVAPTAAYQGPGDQRDLLAGLALTIDELAALRALCADLGIHFVITPDGPLAHHQVLALGPDVVKIGSGDADNPWLLDQVAGATVPVVLSTGMMTDAEVVEAAHRLAAVDQLTVLHCVSAYPTQLADLDLGRMVRLAALTDRPVGLSDHTLGIAGPAAALALGATFVEKHVTWSTAAPGPDHAASLDLADAPRWVAELRDLAVALTDTPALTDQDRNRPLVRKGLYLAQAVAAGTPLSLDHLQALRPVGAGIEASARDRIVGRAVRHDLPAGHLLTIEDLAEP